MDSPSPSYTYGYSGRSRGAVVKVVETTFQSEKSSVTMEIPKGYHLNGMFLTFCIITFLNKINMS